MCVHHACIVQFEILWHTNDYFYPASFCNIVKVCQGGKMTKGLKTHELNHIKSGHDHA